MLSVYVILIWWFLNWVVYLTAIFFSFSQFRLTDHFKMNRAFVAVFLVFIPCSILTVSQLAWGNCRYFEMPQLVSPRNEIWETSAEENPVLITCHFPDLSSETHHQYWISALVPQTTFRGKPEVSSRNVGCFLQLDFMTTLN